MVQIQPVTTWFNGEEKTANFFSLVSVYDNLSSSATFSYGLSETDSNAQLVNGNLTIGGQDYEDWGNQPGVDANTWAYDWAAQQLNLTIIPSTTTTTTTV